MYVRTFYLAAVSAIVLCAAAGLGHAADTSPGSNTSVSSNKADAAIPVGQSLTAAGGLSQQQVAKLLANTEPYPTPQLSALPREAHTLIDPLAISTDAEPAISTGNIGLKSTQSVSVEGPEISSSDAIGGGITPFDYGWGKVATVYHYTDRLLDSELRDDYPYRTVGWLRFVAYNGASYRCTAQLIGRSIGVTAGHCVHKGGNKAAGWVKSATFTPAYANGTAPYGTTQVAWVNTTAGWYKTGALDAGYDVGIFVLRKRTGTTTELGTYTGYNSFCYTNCLQKYWYLTQLGYPANYYSGKYMTQGEHLEVSDSRDYVYGSGMQGGSSGGGHFANLGDLASTTDGSLGLWSKRNVVFATTSWGYIDTSLKVQGASTLSGPNNANKFKELYNAACKFSRSLHGTASCALLP